MHFASASADIPADAQAALATGNADYNRELAKKRALGVRDALVAQGIAIERIILRKPEQTAATGSHAEARRVDLVIVD